jgi:hypothetical protein
MLPEEKYAYLGIARGSVAIFLHALPDVILYTP